MSSNNPRHDVGKTIGFDESVPLMQLKNLLRIPENEDWLIKAVLNYAKLGGYTKYTSTLEEAWRISIHGLSESILSMLEKHPNKIPELNADEDYTKDLAAAFGILEAKLHRSRGITIQLFLALMKYYKQSYLDLVNENVKHPAYADFCKLFLERVFDRIELGFCGEWTQQSGNRLIRDLQTANRKITNEKNKYLTIFESLNTPIVILNDHFEIENANKNAVELFTLSKGSGLVYYRLEDFGSEWQWLKDLIVSFDQEKFMEQTLEREIPTTMGLRTFNIRLQKMLDVSEKFLGLTVIFNDVSDFIELERLRKQFVSTVSHELRTPISSIVLSIGNLQKYQEKMKTAEIIKLYDIIDRNSIRLSQMINDLLVLSRIDLHRLELHKIRVDFLDLIKGVLIELDPKVKLKHLAINIDKSCSTKLTVDPDRFAQILRIILDNAAKYSKDGGSITIQTSDTIEDALNAEKIKGTLIKISDDGIGMKKSDLTQVFQRFFRSDDVKHISGSGLGLPIAKELVELHNGRISVESKLGEGTTVSVFIPSE